jgi:hypothetical protein
VAVLVPSKSAGQCGSHQPAPPAGNLLDLLDCLQVFRLLTAVLELEEENVRVFKAEISVHTAMIRALHVGMSPHRVVITTRGNLVIGNQKDGEDGAASCPKTTIGRLLHVPVCRVWPFD